MPAMCHAGLLKEDYRPLAMIDADSQGAGKGTLVQILTKPYVDNYALVTQDDTSIGSIDEKIASAIMAGKNHVLIDNLKPTRKMKELSSSFIEGMMTAQHIQFRCAGEGMKEIDVRWAMLYATSNGMPLSKDIAERSFYISIRKQDFGYQWTEYEGGLENWLKDNRPKIMSAIYTVLKKYVELGAPNSKPDEGHRFLHSVPAVNYIVKDMLGLPDVSESSRDRSATKSGAHEQAARTICFTLKAKDLLGAGMSSLDIYEVLASLSKEDVIGLDYGMEVYQDESESQFTVDARRSIGIKLSKLLSCDTLLGNPDRKKEKSCTVEEFIMTRSYCGDKKCMVYTVELNDE
jgi:hypothetical protein